MTSKNEATVYEKTEYSSKDNPSFPKLLESVTGDSGSEFAGLSKSLEGLSDIFFAHSYS